MVSQSVLDLLSLWGIYSELHISSFIPYHSQKNVCTSAKGVWICVGRTNVVFRVTWLGGIHSLGWWLVVYLSFLERMQALVALLGIGSHGVYITPCQTNIRPRGFAVHLQPLWWGPLNLHSKTTHPPWGDIGTFDSFCTTQMSRDAKGSTCNLSLPNFTTGPCLYCHSLAHPHMTVRRPLHVANTPKSSNWKGGTSPLWFQFFWCPTDEG